MNPNTNRLQTGIGPLDELLGGGLLPGTLTVVLGATGIGKTQLGLHFAAHGRLQEGEAGVLFDMATRGDAQNHQEYARRLFGWELTERASNVNRDPADVWDRQQARCDYLHVFRQSGRRVTISDMEQDDWREWKIELAKKLQLTIDFLYGNFVHGVRRCVIDGIEPTDKASDSFQLHMVDYIYHQILRKEAEWVARDLFRANYSFNAQRAAEGSYDCGEVGCLLLATSHATLLDDLLARPIESGDALSNANTVILMGKVREGKRMKRALHIAKHRGSFCDDGIHPFKITETGLQIG
jgi:KaiC/GvpD/RAD55 family RecA-like ATPase